MSNEVGVLFVCMGNICRSPAAEGVFRQLLHQEGLEHEVRVDSAGTISLHEGEPPDRRMKEAARSRGIRLEGRARQVSKADFDRFDWILAMDEDNFRNLERMRPSSGEGARLLRFCDLCTEHSDREVPDPYYGGDAGFSHVLDLLEDGCRELLVRVKKERNQDGP